jgi:glycosyltransferase involved in cell wall biosynthesis
VRVSVVIPALNEERHLGHLLSDIQRQSLRPDEVIVVDAGSSDATACIAKHLSTTVLRSEPPVARGRNVGGFSAKGDLIFFLDADTRLPKTFFEEFVSEVEQRRLDVACPRYLPHDSTPTIRAIHAFWDAMLRVFERTLPSGAGHCIAIRSKLFRESRGFDASLKFDDIELVRRLSKGRSFGYVGASVFVSDRRYREEGVLRVFLLHLLMALAFALGKFEWANHIAYEFGDHYHWRTIWQPADHASLLVCAKKGPPGT